MNEIKILLKTIEIEQYSEYKSMFVLFLRTLLESKCLISESHDTHILDFIGVKVTTLLSKTRQKSIKLLLKSFFLS